VKTGYYYTTMDVTLVQDGYWNGTTQTKREWFVEGVDYRNSNASSGSGYVMTAGDWAATGAAAPDQLGDYDRTFNQLNDLQRDAVIRALGYRKLYDFQYSNLRRHQVINGNTTVVAWTPEWSLAPAAGTTKPLHMVNLPVSGWNDKWIRMPLGAEADVLRVVSQGVPTQWNETVGTYKEQASVYYTQDRSGRTAYNVTAREPLYGYFPGLGGITINEYTTRTNSDYDNSPLRYAVSYNTGGQYIYTLNDGTANASKARAPSWYGSNPSVAANDKIGTYTLTPNGYNALTGSITGVQSTVDSWSVAVGTNNNYVPVYYDYHSGKYLYWYSFVADLNNLAQPTNARQNAAITSLLPGGGGWDAVWIGIRRSVPSPESGTQGHFVYETSGNGIVWSNWFNGEPNAAGNHEWVASLLLAPEKRGQWNDIDDNADGYDYSQGYVTVHGGYWYDTTQYETFLKQTRTWTSINQNVTDARLTLNYQWVSNSVDVFDNRPKFRNYDVQTKVVETATVTLYRDEAILQDRTSTRSTRVYPNPVDKTFGEFGSHSFSASQISVDAGRDIRVAGLMQSTGTATLVAGRDLSVLGKALAGVDLEAASEITAGGNLGLTAGRDLALARASVLTSGSGNLVATALAGNLGALGSLSVTGGNATLTAAGDIDARAVLHARNITIAAGSDGSGGISGDISTELLAVGAGAGNITLSAGSASGDIAFNESLVRAAATLDLGAAGGNLYAKGVALEATGLRLSARGSITGDAADSGAFLLAASTLDARSTGNGKLRLQAFGDIDATQLSTAAGSVTLQATGQVTARSATAGSGRALALASGGGQDVRVGALTSGALSLTADRTVTQLAGSAVSADRMELRTRSGVSLGALNVGTMWAAVSAAGDLSLTSTRSQALVLEHLATYDGAIAVTAAGDLAVQEMVSGRSGTRTVAPSAGASLDLTAQPLDVALASGGRISGLGAGTHISTQAPVFTATGDRKAVAGGSLSMTAVNGIEGLVTAVAELRAVATSSGNVSLTNQADAANGRNLLRLSSVQAAAGNVTISTDAALDVRTARALGNGHALTLTSTASDVLLASGAAVEGGGHVTLDAAVNLTIDGSVWVDAPRSVTFRAGTSFVVPTRVAGYDTASLTVVSGESISVSGPLMINALAATDDRVELRSARDITLTGAISRASGSAVQDVVLYADGSNARTVHERDTITGFRVVDAASGRYYLEGTLATNPLAATYVTAGDYWRDVVIDGGTTYYVFDAFKYSLNAGTGAVVATENVKLLSTSDQGSGTLYLVAGTEAGGWSRGAVASTSSTQAFQVIDRGLLRVTAQIAGETGLEVRTRLDSSSTITLAQGRTAYDRMAITAIGSQGNVVLSAAQNLDLDRIRIQATGNVDIATTGGVEAGQILTLEDANGKVYATRTLVSGDLGSQVDMQLGVLGGALANGTYQLYAVITDAYGNSARSADPLTFTITGQGSTLAADTTAPATPTLSSPAGGSRVGSAEALLTGSTEAYGKVRVYRWDGSTETLVGTSLRANAAGQWSVATQALADGAHTLRVRAVDAAGNQSSGYAQLSLTIDTQAPAAPAVTGFASDTTPAGDGRTSDGSLVISGTAEANATIVLYRDDLDGALGATTADGSGHWSFDYTATVLPVGSYVFRATASDATGHVSGRSGGLAVVVTDATDLPAVTLDDVAGDDRITQMEAFAGVTLSGTVDEGATVALRINGGDHAAWVEEGTWSYTLTDADLAALATAGGQLQVRATNALGNTQAVDRTVALSTSAPTLALTTHTDTVTAIDAAGGVVYAGTTTGSAVKLYLTSGEQLAVADVDTSAGTWTVTLDTSSFALLGNGSRTVRIVATDADGNRGSLTHDLDVQANPPAAPTVMGLDDDTAAADFVTRASSVTVYGTAVPGTTLSVSYTWTPEGDYPGSATVVAPAVHALTGAWSLALPEQAGDGQYNLAVTSTLAGLTSEVTEQPVTIEHTAPVLTGTALDIAAGELAKARPQMTGTVESSSLMAIYATQDGATTLLGMAQADPDGNWTFQPDAALAAGSHDIHVVAIDRVGNTSAASGTVTVTSPGPALSLDPVTADDRIDADDRSAGVTLRGSTTAAVLWVQVAGGTPERVDVGQALLQADVTAGGSGYTTVEVVLSAPDLAGGVQATAHAVLVGGEITGIVIDEAGSGYTAPPTVTFNGDGSGATATAQLAAELRRWEWLVADPSGLEDDGSIQVFDAATAGASVALVEHSVAWVDDLVVPAGSNEAVAPAAPVINAAGAGLLRGQAEAYALVELFLQSDTDTALGSVRADGQGNWSFDLVALAPQMANSAENYVLTATDNATTPNTSSHSLPVELVPGAPALDFPSVLGDDTINALDRARGVVLRGTAGFEATAVNLTAGGVTVAATLFPTATGQAWVVRLSDAEVASLGGGLIDFVLTATGAGTSTALTRQVQVGTSAPAAAPSGVQVDTTTINGTATSLTATPQVTGQATANAQVAVFMKEGGARLGTAVADGNGDWTLSAAGYTGTLADGAWTVVAAEVDALGNLGPVSAEVAFTVSAATPAVPGILRIVDDSGRPADGRTNAAAPTVRGLADPGSAVNLYVDGVLENLAPITADAAGRWSYTLSAQADGSHELTARSVNALGAQSEASSGYMLVVDTAPATAPVITTAAGSTGNATPTISGTAAALARVTVKDGSRVLGETVADADGAWSFTPPVALADGAHSFTAFIVNAVGSASADAAAVVLTIDDSGPSVSFGSVTGDDVITVAEREAGVVLTGGVESGASVMVRVPGGERSATVVGDRWTYELTDADYQALGVGPAKTIQVVATDALGNRTQLSRSVDLRTQPLSAPGLPDLKAASDNGASSSDNSTSINTPVIAVAPGTAGAVSNNANRLGAASLSVTSASTIDLSTDVARATLLSPITGSTSLPSVRIANAGNLSLTATLSSGRMIATTGGALTLESVRFTTDLNTNRMDFLAGAGGIWIDSIDALSQGAVYLRTAGEVGEVLSDGALDLLENVDPLLAGSIDRSRSIDVTARLFEANSFTNVNGGNATVYKSNLLALTRLEFSDYLLADAPNRVKVGWDSSFTQADLLQVNTTYELAGYYTDAIDGVTLPDGSRINVVGAYSTQAIDLGATRIVVTGTASSATGLALTGTAIELAPAAKLESRGNNAITLNAGSDGLVMSSDSTIDSDGAITLATTAGGDIVLGQVLGGAGAVNITAGGRLDDGDLRMSSGREVANIVSTGTLNISAAGGIGVEDDRFVINAATVGTLSAGGSELFVELQRASGQTVTVASLTAADADLHALGGGLTLSAASVSGGLRVAADGTGAATGLTLGTLSAGGDVDLSTTAGAIAQSGALSFGSAGSTTTVSAGSSSGTLYDITLSNAGNDFGTLLASGANVNLRDQNALDLGASTVGGNLAVVANGTLTTSGTLSVTGTSSIGVGSTHDIVLDDANHLGGQLSITSARHVTVTTVDALSLAGAMGGQLVASAGTGLTLGATTVGGGADLQAAGAITGTGALVVTGTTTMEAGAGQDITLTNTSNDFGGAVTVAGGRNVSVTDANVLNISAIATGDVALTAGTLGLGESDVGDDLHIIAGSGGASVDTVRVRGRLTVTSDGTVSDIGTLAVAGTSTINAAGRSVVLDSEANDFGGAITVTGAAALTLVDRNDLQLSGSVSGTLALSAGSSLTLGATGAGSLDLSAGGAIASTGAITVTGATLLASAGSDITLSAANNFGGTVSIASARNVTLNDANALSLGDAALTGNLVLTTGGALTQAAGTALSVIGTVDVAAGAGNDITLDAAGNRFTGDVTVTSGRDVTIAADGGLHLISAAVSGDLRLTTTGLLHNTNAWTVAGETFIDAAGQDVVLTAAHDFTGAVHIIARNVIINDVNGLVLGNVALSGSLAVTAGGVLSSTGTLQVAGSTSLTADGISLTQAGNDFTGTVQISSTGSVALRDANALDLGSTAITGGLALTLGGALSDSGAIRVSGATSIAASGQDVVLDAGGHAFGGAVSVAADDFTLRQGGALVLGTVDASGHMELQAGGAISSTGAVRAAGTTRLDAGAHDITLSHAGNQFGGLVTVVEGKNIHLVDSNALAFTGAAAGTGSTLTLSAGGALALGVVSSAGGMSLAGSSVTLDQTTVGGALSVTTAGAVTQASGQLLRVSGTTTLNAGSVALANANTLSGTVSLATNGGATLRSTGALDIGASTVGGALALTAGAGITDSGALTVGGTSTFAAGSGYDIVLDAANQFSGAMQVSGARDVRINVTGGLGLSGIATRDVTITAGGGATLGATTVGRDLAVTAAGITGSGVLAVTGTTTLAAGSGNDIVFDAANDFGGAVAVASARDLRLRDTTGTLSVSGSAARDVTLTATGAADLGAFAIGRHLSVTAAGLTDSGAFSVAGSTTLTAGTANDIVLDAANDFGGAVQVVSARDLRINDTGTLALSGSVTRDLVITATGAADLGVTSVGRDLAVTAAGIADSGALGVAGTSTFTAGTAYDVVLDAASHFGGALTIASARDARINDTGAVNVSANVARDLTVTATGAAALGTTSVGRDLAVTAAGISGSAVVTVAGTTALAAGTGQDVLLSNTANDFTGGVTVASSRHIQLRDANVLTFAGTASGDADIYATTQLFLGATHVAGLLQARGNFTMTSDISGNVIDLVSISFLDMAGHTATATGSGHIRITAQGDVTLGRLVTGSGDVTVETAGGAIIDGLGTAVPNISTTGKVSLLASSGSLAVKLWGSASSGGTDSTIDVVAGRVGDLRAPQGLSLTTSGWSGSFAGAVESSQDLVFDFGADGLRMDSGARFAAGRDLSITSTGDLLLTQASAGRAASVTGAAITGSAGSSAHLQAGSTLVLAGSTLGASSAALRLDAATIRTVNSSGAATLSIVTPQSGNTTPTVTLGGSSDAWNIGGALALDATAAHLLLAGDITAASADVSTAAGRITMTDGRTFNAAGDIRLAGQAGLAVSRVLGSGSHASQHIRLESAAGNITDLTTAETANVVTAGRVSLQARSIGAGGEGDFDVDAGRMAAVQTTLGAAFLETHSAHARLDGASVAGAFSLRADQGTLYVDGNVTAGSLVFEAAAGDLQQADGTRIVVAGAATLTSAGDLGLARLEGADGAVTLVAAGDLLDVSSTEAANVVMSNGRLSLEARRIGSASEDLDLDVADLASVLSTDSSTSATGVHLSSARSATLGTLDASGQAIFRQTGGDLTMSRSVQARAIDLSVSAGSLRQQASAALTADAALSVSASGDIELVAMTSLGGDITLTAGGAIVDATSTERALLVAGADHAVRLTSARIGSDADGGDIEVDAGRLAGATASTGGVWLGFVRSIEVGDVTAATTASLGLPSGDLHLTGDVTAARVEIVVGAGDLAMASGARITAADALDLQASGDMRIGEVRVTGADSTARLAAGGALLDASSAEPSATWNVDAAGTLTLAGSSIGAEDDAFDVRAPRMDTLAATGDSYLSFGGDVVLRRIDAGTNALQLSVSGGDLRVEETLAAGRMDFSVQGGRFVMADGSSASAVGDLVVSASGDVLLSRLVTESGLISVTAGGRILDNTAAELANIVAVGDGSRVRLAGTAVGTVQADGDVDISVASLESITGGAQGVYLQSTRALTLGTVNIGGDLSLDLDAGSLTLAGDVGANNVAMNVDLGALTQQDGTTLTAAGAANVQALRDITLSRMVVQGGDLRMVSSLGGVVDGSVAETANLVVGNGTITALDGHFIGTRYEGGALDVDAQRITAITARDGGAFVNLAGRSGETAQIGSLTATSTGADVGLTVAQGGVQIGQISAADQLQVSVAGNGVTSALRLGHTQAGGDVTLTATAGDIEQLAGASFVADGSGTTTRISAGGDVRLDHAGNDVAALSLTARHAGFTDRDGFTLLASTLSGNLALNAGGTVTMPDGSLVDAGGHITLQVTDGDLAMTGSTRLAAGGDASLQLAGDLTSTTTGNRSATISAGGTLGVQADGGVSLAGRSVLSAGSDVQMQLGQGGFAAGGTTTVTATGGSIGLSVQQGDIALSGTTAFSAGNGIALEIGTGSFSARQQTTLDAGAGTLGLAIGSGQVELRETTRLEGAGVAISVAGTGGLAARDSTRITARDGDINIALADGSFSLRGSSVLEAAQGLQLAVGEGDVSLRDASTLRAQAGTVSLDVGRGDMGFTQATNVLAGTDVQLHIGHGDLSASSATTLAAGRDIRITLDDGQVTLANRSIFNAGRFLVLAASGNLSASGLTTWLAQDGMSLQLEEGSATFRNTTTATAGTHLQLGVGTGDVQFSGVSRFTAGTDLGITIGRGNVVMTEDTTLSAQRDLSIRITQQGGLLMTDADNLLQAGGSVIVGTVDDIRLDLVRAGDRVSLASARGAILDNTASDDDLVFARRLDLVAATGIGVLWTDNLNVNVQEINALNTTRGGINLQNRGGFVVGELGITNLARGDVMLAAGGAIEQGGLLYQRTPAGAGRVSALPGQHIYPISNLSERDLAEQWGDITPQLTSIVTAQPVSMDLAALMRDAGGLQDDEADEDSALRRLLAARFGLQDDASPAQRRIRLGERALLAGPGEILAALGLGTEAGAWWPGGAEEEEEMHESALPPVEGSEGDGEGGAGGEGHEGAPAPARNWPANPPVKQASGAGQPGSMANGDEDFDAPLITPGSQQAAGKETGATGRS
jgi:hypothetical protein